MKNYKVKAIRFFRDASEIDKKTGLKVERKVNDEFLCTKERYEFLKANNAVKLVEVQEEIDNTIEEVVNEIVEEVIESKEINDIIDNVVDEVVEEVFKPKPKKKKTSKK